MPNYTKDIAPGKNLGFKVGPQSKIDTIITNGTGATEGVFYLTYDTHKLYVGVASGSVTPVNEGVVTVPDVNSLPTITENNKKALVGSFYYATKENILCVYNGKAWAQINTDTYVTSSKFTTSQDGTDNVKVNNALTDSIGRTVADAFYVKGKNGVKVTSGTNNNQQKVVEVEGDTYTMSANTSKTTASPDVTLNLDSANTSNDSYVKLTADKFGNDETAAIQFDKTDANNIKVKVRDTVNKSLDITENANGGFTIKVTDSYNKPVMDSFDPTIRYGKDGQEVAHFLAGQATLDILSKNDFNEAMRVLNAMTYRGTLGPDGSAGDRITTSNGVVNIVLKDGTNRKCSVGDMFLVATDDAITYDGKKLSKNTLLIARNKNQSDPSLSGEDAQGFIPNGELAFDVVASTIDVDTQYILQSRGYNNTNTSIGTNGAGVQLYARTGNQGVEGGFEIGAVRSSGSAGDSAQVTGIEVTETTTNLGANGGKLKSMVLKHGNTSRQDTVEAAVNNSSTPNSAATGSSVTVPVVVAVETNASGHVTKVRTKDVTITDTNTTLKSVDLTSSAYVTGVKNVGVMTNTVKVTTGYNKDITKTDKFVFSSDTLTISQDNTVKDAASGAVQNGLAINMLWGSFE